MSLAKLVKFMCLFAKSLYQKVRNVEAISGEKPNGVITNS